jgi:hypothetical protein
MVEELQAKLASYSEPLAAAGRRGSDVCPNIIPIILASKSADKAHPQIQH